MTEDAKDLINELETRFGGSVGYRTYSTWYAATDGAVRDFGVFVYQINSIIHFEDFERKPTMFGIPIGTRKKQPPYQKYEGTIDPKDIEGISRVSKKLALNTVLDGKDPATIPQANIIQKIFSSLVTRILMKDGSAFFFELINHKEFIEIIQKD